MGISQGGQLWEPTSKEEVENMTKVLGLKDNIFYGIKAWIGVESEDGDTWTYTSSDSPVTTWADQMAKDEAEYNGYEKDFVGTEPSCAQKIILYLDYNVWTIKKCSDKQKYICEFYQDFE